MKYVYIFSQYTYLIIQLIANKILVQSKLHTYLSSFSKRIISIFKLILDFFSIWKSYPYFLQGTLLKQMTSFKPEEAF